MLLEDVLKEFIYDAELRGLSKKTIKSYKNNNFLNIRNNAILAMFIETGIRNPELCNLKTC